MSPRKDIPSCFKYKDSKTILTSLIKISMVFEIANKVALVTGGASGIGLRYTEELLRNGARAVAIADLNEDFAKLALAKIEEEFGSNKVIFIKTDTTNINQFEEAFKKTIETFKNIDILFNNAGIYNDAAWEKEIAINVNGVIHGMLLGMEKYISKYKSGKEGLIVNISSMAGISCNPNPAMPIYVATKYAIHGLTKAWGHNFHYEDTKVKVIGICPGLTETPMFTEMSGKNLGPRYEKMRVLIFPIQNLKFPIQSPEQCAQKVISVVKNAPNGTMWVIEGGEPPYQYKMPAKETLK